MNERTVSYEYDPVGNRQTVTENGLPTHAGWTLTYTRPEGITDVGYLVEVSGDLSDWKSGAGFTVPVSLTSLGNGMEQVIVRDAMPLSTHSLKGRFIRLKVTNL